ncbi:MAG: hypothetical protein K8Q99_03585 [Acholeplasmataceae bacterium]|nr:hypothetical protein [Acholeplasmataceae bacterium]
MNYVKKLNDRIPVKTQILMMIVFIAFSIIETIHTTFGFNMLTDILVKLLIGLAVIYLFSEKKIFESYLVLFIGLFIKYIYDFISFILSFQLSNYDFIKTFNFLDLIGSILSIYLVLMIISYILSVKKIEFKMKLSLIIVLLGTYLYMRYGTEYAVVALFLMILLNSIKAKVALNLVMLSYLIHIPFFLIDLIFDRIGFHLLSYWFYGVIGFVLMIVVIVHLLRSLNQENA